MKKSEIPRIVIAGTNSGCGKTTITCAILQALVNQGLKIASFKCGPDYIDPMFHSNVIGTNSSNLDLFFCTSKQLKQLFIKHAENAQFSVIEGVMGFYDGIALASTKSSTYDVACSINSPVVLVINCQGMSYSVLAVIKGFLEFKKKNKIAGVILNQCSKTTYEALKVAIEDEFSHQVKALGYFPKMKEENRFSSRYLGLVTADEIPQLREKMQLLASTAQECIDIKGLLSLGDNAESLEEKKALERGLSLKSKVRIAIAKDHAFCFYYQDNLQLLEELGAELVYFSPLKDRLLPENIQGLWLGGGYPELYAKQLSQNQSMKQDIKERLTMGLPCIAECGGFMYLNQAIDGYQMVGYLKGNCENKNKLVRFGYVTLTAINDHMLLKTGETIKGHEFHYYDCTHNGEAFLATKSNGVTYEQGVNQPYLYAGFAHLHFYSNPKVANRFIRACMEKGRKINVDNETNGNRTKKF